MTGFRPLASKCRITISGTLKTPYVKAIELLFFYLFQFVFKNNDLGLKLSRVIIQGKGGSFCFPLWILALRN